MLLINVKKIYKTLQAVKNYYVNLVSFLWPEVFFLLLNHATFQIDFEWKIELKTNLTCPSNNSTDILVEWKFFSAFSLTNLQNVKWFLISVQNSSSATSLNEWGKISSWKIIIIISHQERVEAKPINTQHWKYSKIEKKKFKILYLLISFQEYQNTLGSKIFF